MTKDERAIIDKFLGNNELFTIKGELQPAKSVSDVENAERRWESKLAKNQVYSDLANEYRGRVSRDIKGIDMLLDMTFDLLGKYGGKRYPSELQPEEYERGLRIIRTLGDALAKEFPADGGEKGA